MPLRASAHPEAVSSSRSNGISLCTVNKARCSSRAHVILEATVVLDFLISVIQNLLGRIRPSGPIPEGYA